VLIGVTSIFGISKRKPKIGSEVAYSRSRYYQYLYGIAASQRNARYRAQDYKKSFDEFVTGQLKI
jgi:hypothetical protein